MQENNVFPNTIPDENYKIVFGVKNAWNDLKDENNNFMVGPVIVHTVEQISKALALMIEEAYIALGSNLYFHSFTIKNVASEEMK